ncbi:hypothetical protein ACC690_39210, partial [Rhizobium johnstonii]
PFGITCGPSASFNPMDGFNPACIDVAEDFSTLADALVFDEPGLSGDAHWNEDMNGPERLSCITCDLRILALRIDADDRA